MQIISSDGKILPIFSLFGARMSVHRKHADLASDPSSIYHSTWFTSQPFADVLSEIASAKIGTFAVMLNEWGSITLVCKKIDSSGSSFTARYYLKHDETGISLISSKAETRVYRSFQSFLKDMNLTTPLSVWKTRQEDLKLMEAEAVS